MTFEFSTAGRVLFGEGTVRQVPEMASSYGNRAFVVTGKTPGRHDGLVKSLGAAGIHVELFPVRGEPTVDIVREGIEAARKFSPAIVIGIGGGSVIDAAKAVAAFVTNGGDLMDHLEVIGGARPLERPGIPCIAVPTTAGTGSEVTKNSVIASPERRIKVSLRSLHIIPRVTVVDPELTYSLPPEETAACGLDALTQLIEPFLSSRANALTDSLCREGMVLAASSLHIAYEDGSDRDARRDMALASLMSGMALANAGLGAVHGLAAVIGGMFPASPHGAVCAVLLPRVFLANWRGARNHGSAEVLEKFREAAAILTGDPHGAVEDAVDWLGSLCADLAIPGLSRYGVTADHVSAIVEQARKASSMKANPVQLTAAELAGIVNAAL
ncbi:MAG: iron-containing alcohol dehydrogenase [Spirochaetes bacterium]|nr:iron-containing alcohol dehydrogenase [Spirochaetota bacterium]